jgi:hypothetical protein
MAHRLLIALSPVILLGLFAAPAWADSNAWHSNWNGNSFGSQLPVYDFAGAMKSASLAHSDFDAAKANLAATLARAHSEFENSPQFAAARQELAEARHAYEEACAPVRAGVSGDPAYRSLVEKRTELEIELRSVTSRSVRQDLAARKLNYSAQANLMVSDALARDANVQNAKIRLAHAQQAVADQEARFQAEFYSLPEVMAAQKTVEAARASRDAADAYLYGTMMGRADLLNVAAANSAPVDSNGYGGGYPYGYYGFGPFWGGGGFFIAGSGHMHHHS